MESGNLLGVFATDALALAAVREAVERNGSQHGVILALGRELSRGGFRIVATGSELVARAADQPVSVSTNGRRHARSS
jgi:hypothetical protein